MWYPLEVIRTPPLEGVVGAMFELFITVVVAVVLLVTPHTKNEGGLHGAPVWVCDDEWINKNNNRHYLQTPLALD